MAKTVQKQRSPSVGKYVFSDNFWEWPRFILFRYTLSNIMISAKGWQVQSCGYCFFRKHWTQSYNQTFHCVLVFIVGVVALGIISVIGLCVTQVASQQHFLGQFHQFQPRRQTINKTRPGQLLSHSSSLIKLHKC